MSRIEHPHTYPVGTPVFVLADSAGLEIPPFGAGEVSAFVWADADRTQPAYLVGNQAYAEHQLGTQADVDDIG